MNGARLWLGTAAFGSWGNTDRASCVATIRRAMDLGVATIDTAEFYSDGEAEAIVGDAVDGHRDEVFLATKFGYRKPKTATAPMGRKDVVARAEASLRRLRTDHIDLYQLHRLHPDDVVEEIVSGLDDLVAAGKVLAVGTSMLTPEVLARVHTTLQATSVGGIATEQAAYSIFVREIERTVAATCRRLGINLVAAAPMNGGWLSGQYRGGAVPQSSRAARWPVRPERFDFGRPEIRAKVALLEGLDAIAALVPCTLPELAIAFVLRHPDVTAAIVGPRTPEHVDPLVQAAGVKLADHVVARIVELIPEGTTIDPEDIAAYDDASSTGGG